MVRLIAFFFVCLLSFSCKAYDSASSVDIGVLNGGAVELNGIMYEASENQCDDVTVYTVRQCNALRSVRVHSPNYGFMADVKWFVFSVHNSSHERQLAYVEINHPLLDYIDFYHVDDQNRLLKVVKTGDKLPFHERPVKHPAFTFPIELAPNEKRDIRIRVDTLSSMQIPIKIWHPDDYVSFLSFELLVFGLFIGAMVLMALYNFLLFFSTLDKAYLLFALTLFFYALVQTDLTGISYAYLWPQAVEWNDKSLYVMGSLALIHLVMFAYYFLNLAENSTFTRLLVKAVTGFSLLGLCITPFVPNHYLVVSLAVSIAAVPVAVYFKAAALFIKGYTPARYFLLAFSFFVVSICIFILNKFGVLPRTWYTEYSFHIGAAGVVSLLSLALADRVNQEKRARESAQTKAIATLKKFEELYQNSSEGLFRLNMKGDFIAANNTMLALLNEPHIDMLKQDVSNIRALTLEENDLLADVLEHDHVMMDLELQPVDKPPFWAQLRLRKVLDPLEKTHIIEGSVVDISERKRSEEQLVYLAKVDQLTGLCNRNAFQEALYSVIHETRHQCGQHALFYIDLDRFKLVNDTCGHHAGDELLKQLATMFKSLFSESACLARIGGDEFAIIMRNLGRDACEALASDVQRHLARYRFTWDEKHFDVGASIGIVPINKYAQSVAILMNKADSVCMMAKELGRNRFVYMDENEEDVRRQMTAKNMLLTIHEAIENSRFVLFRQKIESLHDASFNGFEVLIRMHHEGGLLMPGAFIDTAERYNVMVNIDKWVISALVDELNRHPDLLARLDMATVNLSAQTLSDRNFLPYLLDLLEAHPHISQKLCFELTESAALNNLSESSELVVQMKCLGAKFAVDDFGSGYASYNYLTKLPVDFVKIDGSFCLNIENDPVNQMVVRSITEIAHTMGIKVIAEFIENEAALNCLKEIGVDFVQGYFIEKPVPMLSQPQLSSADKTPIPFYST
ncbi:EAL domain-containing protein [Aestuariibacter sp. AA17]|uniref:EAL domain-containing protein n=1 Tax=Fluctibacter corallii TaxID=2984329 RepID=A0ABT3AE76_9ALTE|nr:EAL domain-containing protein [Aestuariibacter sp. AA17]MCV2886612.1 EAL domain-containing protein [Aestuariibacter sp. AA17]